VAWRTGVAAPCARRPTVARPRVRPEVVPRASPRPSRPRLRAQRARFAEFPDRRVKLSTNDVLCFEPPSDVRAQSPASRSPSSQ
jgi:hypothetical protein